MPLNAKRLPLIIAVAICSPYLMADHMEEMVIKDEQLDRTELSADIANITSADTAQLLRTIPGANTNSLGALTGIAQYRGLAGDRISIHLDAGPAFSGGPNAMDAPLSYAPSALLESLSVTRGIASVSSGQETLGGHIEAKLNRGEFAEASQFQINGALISRYQSVNNSISSAARLTTANNHHRFSLLASLDNGSDTDFANGTIDGTEFERSRYDLSYGYQNGDSHLLAYVGKNNTEDTGTPALAMDIDHIDTTLAGLQLGTSLSDIKLSTYVNWTDVEHGMNNFEHRPAPMMGMDYRANTVEGDKLAFGLNAQLDVAAGSLTLGIDRSSQDENSTITNPNNAMFELVNFNDVNRDIDGLFAEWKANFSQLSVEMGVRHNRTDMDADAVSASGMMGMMGMNASILAMAFNNADRNQSFNYTDLVLKTRYILSDATSLELGIARKHRAPSYQESYVWLPLPITGGLADGRSYIGNLNLDEEQSDEITLGLNWDNGSAYFTPQLFFRDVTDYIQGTPATNMTANMVATMMSGAPALQYNNVDAELYGFDAGYGYRINEQWRLDGGISYVQGQRTDADDYLYRIAPTNHRLALSYQQDELSLQLESVLYASQDKASAFNSEQKTAGYGLLNLRGHYSINKWLTLSAGIENLLDKSYQDHLAGYNRVSGGDIALDDRLYGYGRNLLLSVQLEL